jgi:hypothetical protein
VREYVQSDEIQDVAEKLISMHHEHLKGAAIAYLMHKVDKDKSDQLSIPVKRAGHAHKIASARIVPENYHALCGFDFLLTVDERFWILFDEDKRIALIDHELSHMRKDEDGFYCASHDLEEFSDIIVRHGYWKADVRRFMEAVQRPLPFEQESSHTETMQSVQ